MKARSRVLTVVVCLAASGTASAQSISGRVLMPDSITPAVGIVVTVTGANNVVAGRVLSSASGAWSVRLKTVGRFEVRALRIGFRPTVITVVVGVGENVRRDIVVTSLPVTIAAMNVDGDRDCTLKGRDGQTFLTLWEQARAALAATSLWEQSGALDIDIVRSTGRRDRLDGWPRPDMDSLYVRLDTNDVRQLAVNRVFAATRPETLAAAGYVRASADGRPIYDMPNAEALLSDDFVGSHCFSLKKHDDHPEWIGFGFEPRRRVGRVVDIKGVLWLDRATAELRSLDFEYANLPDAGYAVCDSAPLIKVTPDMLKEVPVFRQPEPRCYTHKDDHRNRLGLGGSADFVRLPTGEWLVSRWTLLTPPDEAKYRKTYKSRYNRVTKQPERCWDGPDCRTGVIMIPRLIFVSGTTSRVSRDGVELYRDSSDQPLADAMIRKRAKDGVADVVGVVVEGNKRVVNAIVQTEDPWRAARTDTAGIFRFPQMPAGRLIVSVRCAGFTPTRFRVQVPKGAPHRVRIDLQRDTTVVPVMACNVR